MTSDPRDEMRRILNRPPERSSSARVQSKPDWIDAMIEMPGRFSVARSEEISSTETCLSGMLRIATDALDAAGSLLED